MQRFRPAEYEYENSTGATFRSRVQDWTYKGIIHQLFLALYSQFSLPLSCDIGLRLYSGTFPARVLGNSNECIDVALHLRLVFLVAPRDARGVFVKDPEALENSWIIVCDLSR